MAAVIHPVRFQVGDRVTVLALGKPGHVRTPDYTLGKTGEVIEIKTLISHPMETGLRKDKDGNAVPRNIIHTFAATFDGKPVDFREPAEAIAAGMGYCSEDRKSQGIVPGMSVAENMTLALMPALTRSGTLDEAKQREIVERFIKKIGIKCSGPNQKIRELSGGNQQKVLLARWLCMNPKLLILDEPTGGICVGAKAEIQGLIRQLASDGLGVLMISSELEEIVEGADRVFVLREGRTVAELDREHITESGVMHAMAHGHDTDSQGHEGASPRV